MMDSGIVPALTGDELSEMLSSLNEADQRKAKRKFRKMWRNLLKKDPDLKDLMLEKKGSDPSKERKRNRAVLVVYNFFMLD
jgi:hypothetical protein